MAETVVDVSLFEFEGNEVQGSVYAAALAAAGLPPVVDVYTERGADVARALVRFDAAELSPEQRRQVVTVARQHDGPAAILRVLRESYQASVKIRTSQLQSARVAGGRTPAKIEAEGVKIEAVIESETDAAAMERTLAAYQDGQSGGGAGAIQVAVVLLVLLGSFAAGLYALGFRP